MLSNYEKARLQNIKRNNEKLKELGIDTIRIPKPQINSNQSRTRKRQATKRQASSTLQRVPKRRSTRNTGKEPVKYTGMTIENQKGDSDYDSEEDSDSDEEDDDTDYKTIQSSSRITKTRSIATTPGSTTPGSKTLLTVEHAKTGRAKCRLCRESILKDAPRIGLMTWICGRNCVTWQHPQCFMSRVSVGIGNNKTKCKVTGEPIESFQVKFGCRSHSTTSWISMEALPNVMLPVLSVMNVADNAANTNTMPRNMDGIEKLNEQQRNAMNEILNQTDELFKRSLEDTKKDTKQNVKVKVEKKEKKVKKVVVKGDVSTQPKIGIKTNAKGNCSWKFGAYLCHGSLLASKETKTHCYARTHKGNVKTLKKGGTYWWMD